MKFKSKLKNFGADQKGVAAIEFVLTFPILISLFFGCIELYGHFNAVRKLGNVTASLADIVAQSRSVSENQLNALRPLAQSLMQPLDSNAISYTITNVRQGDAGDDPTMVWQLTHGSNGASNLNADTTATCDAFTGAPDKNFPPNQDSIYVSVEYTYDSLFSEFVGGPTTYDDDMISIPRSSNTVNITGESLCS